MVIGEAQKMPAALIQINFEYAREWGKRNGHKIENFQENKDLRQRIQKEIDVCNKNFGNWEQIKEFEITEGRVDSNIRPLNSHTKNEEKSNFRKT